MECGLTELIDTLINRKHIMDWEREKKVGTYDVVQTRDCFRSVRVLD